MADCSTVNRYQPGRGGDVDATDMTCELAQVAHIAITAVILAKQRSIKVVHKEQLR
jgi:hypothetical protein